MYSNAEKQRKASNSRTNIYDLAEKVREQSQGMNEALQIMNAYRKVEDISVPNSNINNQGKKNKEGKAEARKPVSEYANKVKETLKELNANRKKESEHIRDIPKPVINEKVSGLGSAERHLIQSGLRKLFKLMCKKYEKYMEEGFKKVVAAGTEDHEGNQQKIRKWKLRRLFSGWQYEAMLCKIEKQRIQKEEAEKNKRQMRLAVDFNYFWSIKKFFKSWGLETKRALKKRQFQLEQDMRRQEELKRIEEQKKVQSEKQRKRQIQPNLELQSKLRGFLDGLKQQIQGKDRLNTIKQKTEQREQGEVSNVQSHENGPENQENPNPSPQEEPHNEQGENAGENQYQGPLTNQDLEKKRKQLEKKAKQRKEALEKLKRDRQQKKKQEQQEKLALERQIQQEQKKARQEQYRKFMKQKKQEQEWKQKEKELERQAAEFDRLRLMRFYGWAYWRKLEPLNLQNAQHMGDLLHRIVLKRRLETFVTGLTERGEAKLKEAQEKAQKYYLKKLKKKCIEKLKQWKSEQLDLKDELSARHEVNTLKIYFQEWQRGRNQIQLQNYQWQRPRLKRAECLHSMTLMHKAFQSLKLNRDEQIQNRNVEQHKAKIKEKVHKIVEEQPTINYDDFL